MIGYIILFLGLLLFTVLCNQRGKSNQALLVLGLTLLFVYMALDMKKIHDVSLYEDSFNFYKHYSLAQLNSIDTYEEQGYVALNILCSKFSSDFRFFYFFYAIVVVTSHLFLIRKYSKNIWFSSMLLVGSFFFPLFLMRQYFATAFCLFSIPFILDRKPIPFVLCMLAAYFFHRTSIVFSLCYFLPLLKVNVKTILLVLVVGVFAVLSIGLFNVYFVAMVGDSELASHYMEYVNDDSSNSWKSAVIPVVAFLFALFSYKGHFGELDKKQSLFFFMSAVYAILSIVDVSGTSFSAIYRILPYFGLSVIILLPDATGYIKSKSVRTVSTTAILLLYMYSLISTAGPWFHFTI